MFRFTVRDLLWLMVVALAVGCGRTSRKIETVRRGAEAVDQHAKDIEAASQPEKLNSAPSPAINSPPVPE